MEQALVLLVVVVTVVCAAIAVVTLAGSGKTYRQVGAGGIEPAAPGDLHSETIGGSDGLRDDVRQREL